MTTTPQAALLSRMDAYLSGNSCEATAIIKDARAILAKLQATQAEPAHAGSASLLDGCKSIMDSIAVSSSVIEHNRQEPVQAEPTLRDYADSLIKAGHDFWKACRREAGGGAVRWISCDDGTLVVFTRGEYRDTIMENIGCYKAPEVFFEEDGITAAESKEPVQAGELPEEPDMESALAAMGITVWGPRAEAFKAGADWQAALSARKPLTCGDLNPDRIFGLADVHADESQEDGRRIFDRDGLVGFAMDAARIGAYPATAPLTKAQIKDLAQDEELLLICDGLDSLEDIVSVIERAHGIGLEVKP